MRRKKSSSSSSSSMDRGGGGGSELFICFTSRPSASSSSSAAAAPSLSASLSRRLRNSGSMKGAQSPMFTAMVGGRRSKGCSFETAEPSSPKVTCIGQVRVKGHKRRSKAKGAISRSRSKRVAGAEASFRRGDGETGRERECLPGGRGQGWVYQIPVSICEALKAVGSEFNCFLPCSGRSFCSSSRTPAGEADEEEGKVKRRGSCGAVLARWLMLQESEGPRREREIFEQEEAEIEEERGKGEMGLLLGDWEEEKRMVEEFEVEVAKKDEILVVGEEEQGRVSVCIPPRNALLLMRCRSDPVRMAALANRLWGSPVRKFDVKEEKDEGEEEADEEREGGGEGEESAAIVGENDIDGTVGADLKEMETEGSSNHGEVLGLAVEEKQDLLEQTEETLETNVEKEMEKEQHGESMEKETEIVQKDCILDDTSAPAELDPLVVTVTKQETEETQPELREKEEEKEVEQVKGRRSLERKSRCSRTRRRSGGSGSSSSRDKESRRHSFSTDREAKRPSFSSLKEARRSSFSIDGRRWSFSIEQEELIITEPSPKISKGRKTEPGKEKDRENAGADDPIGQKREETVKSETGVAESGAGEDEPKEKQDPAQMKEERKKSGELPDCLLLMMYEPKLSMEVSKETWVRSTDFVNWKSHQSRRNPAKPSAGAEETRTKPDTERQNDSECCENKPAAEPANPVPQQPPPPPPPPPPPQPPAPVVVVATPVALAMDQKLKPELQIPAEVLYAPFVLKRCKSEPMRSSARLAPDACFWKDRHRPIGAVGF